MHHTAWYIGVYYWHQRAAEWEAWQPSS